MGLAVTGEKAMWLNILCLGDSQDAEVRGTSNDLTKGLFGLVLEMMKDTSTFRKQEGEAFNFRFLHKPKPHPLQ